MVFTGRNTLCHLDLCVIWKLSLAMELCSWCDQSFNIRILSSLSLGRRGMASVIYCTFLTFSLRFSLSCSVSVLDWFSFWLFLSLSLSPPHSLSLLTLLYWLLLSLSLWLLLSLHLKTSLYFSFSPQLESSFFYFLSSVCLSFSFAV